MALGTPLPPPRAARRAPSALATPLALLLLALALGVDLVAALLPWFALRGGDPIPDAQALAASVLSLLVGAGVAATVGRGVLRRLLAAGTVVAAIPLHVAFWFVTSRGPLRPDTIDEAQVMVVVQQVVIGTILVAAWGIARRQGAWWWLPLPLAAVLATAQYLVREPVNRVVQDLADGTGEPILAIGAMSWAWAVVPMLVTGIACWLVDLARPAHG